MTAPTLNVPLAEAVLKQITEHPEQHDQASFGVRRADCGTTYCIAGWAIALSPDVVEYDWHDSWRGPYEAMSSVRFRDGRPRVDGWRSEPFAAGRELLGLSGEDADWLFLDCGETEAVDYLRHLIATAVKP